MRLWAGKNEPKPGDIFLWRSGDEGHTGIVVRYNSKTKIVTTTEARGVAYGTLKEQDRSLNVFTSMPGWQGFFRPTNENADEDEDEDGHSWLPKINLDDLINGKWPPKDKKEVNEDFLGPTNLKGLLQGTKAYEFINEKGRKFYEWYEKWRVSKNSQEFYELQRHR